MTARRSLILAGGGMKVAFQAGVLQVWLDEAGLRFDHVDAASGAVFNLAMLCQGMTGSQVADNWRDLPALDAVQPNWRSMLRPLSGESIARLDGLRSRIFPRWGLDFDAIRASTLEATFNTYNFSRHELAVLTPPEVTEDLLVSAVSLPMWFPPVAIDGAIYLDSVYMTDANVEEAIRRGADELWVIWTVSERSEWHSGFLGHYFGIIETAANGNFRRISRRIADSNAAIARGEEGEFGRRIELKVLRGEVPLHYLLNFNPDRFTAAVERGVRDARRWCEAERISLAAPRPRASRPRSGLRFPQRLRGNIGEAELTMRLTVTIDDVGELVADPDYEARVDGRVECPALGGDLAVERGALRLLSYESDPARRRTLYKLHLRGEDGRRVTLIASQSLDGSSGRGAWHEATTLDFRVVDGHADDESAARDGVVARGRIRVGVREIGSQLARTRATGPAASRADIRRFALLYLGGLWDVYGRRLLPVSPV